MKRWGVDLDGVCRNFVDTFYNMFVAYHPHLKDKIGPRIHYHFDNYPFEGLPYTPQEFMENYIAKELFALADPVEGAIEACEQIQQLAEQTGNKAIVVSHQQPPVQKYTHMWVRLNGMPIKDTILVIDSANKWKHVDVMIDDSPHVLAKKPEGKISIKVNHPYNVDTPADYSINHISEAIPILQELSQ